VVYFIGFISGAFSGIGLVLLGKIVSTNHGLKPSKSETLFWQIFIFVLMAFLGGPLVSYLYAKKFSLEGPDALISHAFVTMAGVLPFFIIGLWQNKNIWKTYIPISILVVFGMCWLLPLLYNLIF
jgi:hypothetical protein